MDEIRVKRLVPGEVALGLRLFEVMAGVFEEGRAALSASYVEGLLVQPGFWAMVALRGEDVLGGLTAHVLPMTRDESSELFIYDIAVVEAEQRRGVGRALVQGLRDAAAESGIAVAFVPAEADDDSRQGLIVSRQRGDTHAEVCELARRLLRR
jgi:aminoglycoside 3-N-acetyltransferase I